jgi:hypothetical protein
LANLLNKLDKKNIIISSFKNPNNLKNVIVNKNINYILPMSEIDYKLIKNVNSELYGNIKIIYPTKETFELENNTV